MVVAEKSNGVAPGKDDDPANKAQREALKTEEDSKLEADLDMLVARIQEADKSLWRPSLESMRTLIRSATTSMTSVPKPLKFMMKHYDTMKAVHERWSDSPERKLCADLISVLSMTAEASGDCVKYRLLGSGGAIDDWGHEFVRHMTLELVEEWRAAAENPARREELLVQVRLAVQNHMDHNSEVEACDLLIEIERLDLLPEFTIEANHGRVCLYLQSCAPLTPDPDNTTMLRTAKELYVKYGRWLEALRCAAMLYESPDAMLQLFHSAQDPTLRKQMALFLGRHQVFLEYGDLEDAETLAELNSNSKLTDYFKSLARELDIMEPKTPEAVYKTHLENSRPFGSSAQPDSNRMNLAGVFVNGFVNCGFGVDKMLMDVTDANKWFYRNKDYGMLSAAASQGLVWRWDVNAGLSQCDRFHDVEEDHIKAGTLLAMGIISSGVQDQVDPVCGVLIDHVHSDRAIMRVGSILGLGLAYSNSRREIVLKNEEGHVAHELKKVMIDSRPSATLEVKGLTGLSLGLIHVGTGNYEVANEILQTLHERNERELADPNMRLLALGAALIFLGTQEKSEVFVEAVRPLAAPFGAMVATLVDVCAYAGTGNVLKIQQLLHLCSEHYDTPETIKQKNKERGGATGREEKKYDATKDLSQQQAVAVFGIGLISMGEDVGTHMALRMFGHLIRYGEPVIRRAVPLALALLSVSNPQLNILETLSKFSHDADGDTAHNAIFAMGIVGAGTNNARLVAMLRQLASYHHKDQTSLMLVRVAQGLTHLGKGTLTLNPFHSDRALFCPSALAGLLSTCFVFLDATSTVIGNGRQQYLLYLLSLAMQPRMLITLVEDEKGELEEKPVSVRVGQAVDTIAQAGRPKTITGFHTHTTPVLLAHGERAELANEEYIAMTPYLEGLVILKKNPAYEEKRSATAAATSTKA